MGVTDDAGIVVGRGVITGEVGVERLCCTVMGELVVGIGADAGGDAAPLGAHELGRVVVAGVVGLDNGTNAAVGCCNTGGVEDGTIIGTGFCTVLAEACVLGSPPPSATSRSASKGADRPSLKIRRAASRL